MLDDIKIVGLSTKKSKPTNWKVLGAIIGVIVLSVGVIAGILLVKQQQDIREKAAGNCDSPETIVKCPAPDGNLYSCNPPDQNNNALISQCNLAGRIELCGIGNNIVQYCCPSAGGSWTTDMSGCSCQAAPPTGFSVEQVSSTSVILKWTPGTGGTKTRLWVSTNVEPTGNCALGGAANCIVNDQALLMTTSQHELTNLTPNTKYYWRLMTWQVEGCDAGSAVMNFTTSQVIVATSTPSVTAIATATPTRTPTPTPTPTPTATSTGSNKTATPTSISTTVANASATSTATTFPVPETGADFPTIIGVGFGIIMILLSLALAL